MIDQLMERHDVHTDDLRLRAPNAGDRDELGAFLGAISAGELELHRALRWDLYASWAVVAIDSYDTIVGLAMVDADDGHPMLLAEDPGVYDVLAHALADRAAPPVPRRVA